MALLFKNKHNDNDDFYKLGHKVIQNYNEQIKKSKKKDLIPCILVATGTFSPIHRMHIMNMELSKEHIESKNPKHRVLGGFLCPTHDSYCRYKLGNLSISATHRIKMISLAVEDSDWLEVDPWHPNQESMQTIDDEVGHIENMIKAIYAKKSKKFQIFYVCGSDLAIRSCFYRGFGHYGVAIIQRESDPMKASMIKQNEFKPPIYLIDIPKQYDKIKNASSTELRACIAKGAEINHLTFDEVQKYMVENDILGAAKLKEVVLKSTDDQKTDNEINKISE